MKLDPQQLILLTPYGPMVHRDTGETYQAHGARLEHEHQQRAADSTTTKGNTWQLQSDQ